MITPVRVSKKPRAVHYPLGMSALRARRYVLFDLRAFAQAHAFPSLVVGGVK